MQSLQTPPVNTTAPRNKSGAAPPKKTGGRLADKALITFFSSESCWHLVQDIPFAVHQVSEENRTLAPVPKWPGRQAARRNIAPRPLQFDAFYTDRMLARTFMVKVLELAILMPVCTVRRPTWLPASAQSREKERAWSQGKHRQ